MPRLKDVISYWAQFNRTVFFVAIILLAQEAHALRRKPRLEPVQIREIRIDVQNVFDPAVPGENAAIFQVANRIHIRTRDRVIRGFLLAKPGQGTTKELLEESERILRAQSFIKSAEITTEPVPGGQVDLVIKTQDTWTLQPQFNYGQEGGETKISTGFLEENFLGYGKQLSYFYKKDRDGVAHELGYKDPLLFGTRFTLDSKFEAFPTGNSQHVALNRPFFSLATRYALGIDFENETRLQKIFEAGQEINRYQRDAFSVNPSFGYLLKGKEGSAHRLIQSYQYREEVFSAQPQSDLTQMPPNRTFSGPQTTWTYEESRFIKETYIDRVDRVEDFNLGHRAQTGLGYFGKKLGSSENSLPFTAAHAFGFGGEGAWFGTASYGSTGRYYLYETGQRGGRATNTLYFANVNMYRHRVTVVPMTGVLHVEGAYVQNADAQNQLELGGDTGLRGYKNTAFNGNKSMLMNLEGRVFYPKEFLHLFIFGAATFFDAGQVQPSGEKMALRDMQANVGAGLRIGLTRASGGSVIRIDMAYALRKYPGENKWVLSITTGPGFKSSGNTFAKYGGTPSL